VRRELRNVLRVLVAIVLGMVVCWLIGGCSPRVVEVERPVVVEQTHTQTHTNIVRDTLIWRDSVYHYVQGDTVRIERWHHTQTINRVQVTDTIRDTIPRVVTQTITEVREVSRLRWYHYIAIVTLVFILALVFKRFIK